MLKKYFLTVTGLLYALFTAAMPLPSTEKQYDLVVYGGTSAGVIAAYTASTMGKSVLLIEPGSHLGGLTTGGLGYTDIGNKYAITGLSRDFYRRIGRHYGKFEQWIFEPHVAEAVFQDYISRAGVEVLYEHRIVSALKEQAYIRHMVVENSTAPRKKSRQTIAARMFIDCSYEGDLMASAGVSYTTGREANTVYNETYNGVQLMEGHQFPDGIDPYRIPGKPETGLLWGISDAPLPPNGTGDSSIQAYNYRICLTDDTANRVPITRPEGYDSSRYELLLRLFEAQPQKRKLNDYFIWSGMPNRKTDINNRGGFSTDMIGMNYAYPEADYAQRQEIIRDHAVYTQGLLYFYGHDPRVPAALRQEMLRWGYPKDEYTDNGHWSPQLYVREVRRMLGAYVMTQANCLGQEVVTDGVGMAAYTMDSHNCQRIVVEKNGRAMVKNEGNVEIGGFGPYPIAYRALTPRAEECRNLLVPVCLSASHIAYGSIRMEPVFMVLAQSAAVAAVMAMETGQAVQDISVEKLQHTLRSNPLADGSTPEILVDEQDREHVTVRGDWETIEQGSYGPGMLVSKEGSSTEQWVQFTPAIDSAGRYSLYAYFPRHSADRTLIEVFDGRKHSEKTIRKEEIVVEGQTSGEWVPLGTYTLPRGKAAYVKVSDRGAGGPVVADAVLFVPDTR